MNRLLAYLITWAIFIAVFLLVVEGGLCLLDMGPKETINQFHPKLGWVKKPNTLAEHSTSEFEITYRINSQGLREDENLEVEKPASGVKRVVLLGDSFTLGYTVNRENLFVDLLESKLNEEGRKDKIEIINAGTEGYSSDQELLWLREEGLKYGPDIAVMNFYQNDVYWCSQDHYMRFPKPKFSEKGPAGAPEKALLEDPGEQGWFTGSTAIGQFFAQRGAGMELYTTPKGSRIPKEWAVLLKKEPDFITASWNHFRSVLEGFKKTCEDRKIKPMLALIPTKAQIYSQFREEQGAQLGLSDDAWDPDLPFKKVLAICREIGLDVMDPRNLFASEADQGIDLYYIKDRHFSPEGNRAYAQALYYQLVRAEFLGKPPEASPPIAVGSGAATAGLSASGLPTWLYVVLGLWLVLGFLYAVNYRDENGFLGFLKVGTLIWVVAGLIALINWLAAVLPQGVRGPFFGLIILAIVVFLIWKLRKRMGLIVELYSDFTNRGHWYMMPLLAVMLAIGSLLIVAASSPFVAPFIYTLF
jgi:lysophospholipase L1-like esterase